MTKNIVRTEFTDFDQNFSPQFDSGAYLEYEELTTPISTSTVTFGYKNVDTGEWIKLEDVPAICKPNRN